ncbi:MAG: hypothetical protein JWN25_3416 [Verrucomicrobiales bacterium]|nr:hypothetical protein [Verrucomicrobiales bacterium]
MGRKPFLLLCCHVSAEYRKFETHMLPTKLLLGIGLLTAFFTSVVQAHNPAAEMADAANNYLATLTPEQKEKGVFEFKADERENWHFIPKKRNGLPIKEMTHFQRPLAHALLASALSPHGFAKAETIMSLEEVLRVMELKNPGMVRDPEMYFVSIFGEPSTNKTWGWRVEGHHLSVNFTIADGANISSTPSFLGSNPGEIKDGPRKGLRVLAHEEELGRALIKALDHDQQSVAVYTNKTPSDIITLAARQVSALATVGLPASKMTKPQQEMLRALINEYISRDRAELADTDWKKIEKGGFDNINFAWAGGFEAGQPHYYRVQGPTFLLEYDNTQNNNNHIHAVWRDFDHDFGRDILGEHYKNSPH